MSGHERRGDLGAERAFLGAAMMSPEVVDDATLDPADFWHPAHEELYRIMCDERRLGRPLDPVSLADVLPVPPALPDLTPVYLFQLLEGGPWTPHHARRHAELVAALAQLRRLQEAGARIGELGTTTGVDAVHDAVDAARGHLDDIANRTADVSQRGLAEVIAEALPAWEGVEKREAYATGWSALDDVLHGGLAPGHVTVVGARPAVGKSLVATCAAVALLSAGHGVGFFSLEMSDRELVARMVSSMAGVPLADLNAGRLTPDQAEVVRAAMTASTHLPFRIEDKPRRSMAYIRSVVRTWVRKVGLKVVIIDYLQLVAPADPKETRERQVSRIAEDCKALAKELNVHVLVLAQVNRGSVHREDKRPTMADLRESGGIEAHADNIVLLHRPDGPEDDGSTIEFLLVKNRHGQTTTVELVWRPDLAAIQSPGMGHRDFPHGRPDILARRRMSAVR